MKAPLLALALVAALAAPAAAHTTSDGFVDLDVRGATVAGRVDLAVRDLHDAIGLDDGDGRLTWGEVTARHDAIAAYLRAHLALTADAGPCPLDAAGLGAVRRADGLHVAIDVTARCPAAPATLTLDYRAVFEVDARHRAVIRVGDGTTVATAAGPVRIDVADPSTDVAAFVREGVWHIWIGFDHILFLIALLLPAVLARKGGAWEPAERLGDVVRDVLGVVTAFTLAHSITLVISAVGWIRLPARFVETAIAISVALAAINNLVRVIDARWAVAFGLGLLHGFGFSGVLADVGLPGDGLVAALLGFNLGVELGQAAIVAAFLPLAYLARRTTTYRFVLYAGSAATVLVAARWSLERLSS